MPDREGVIKKLESLRDICNAKSNMAIGNGKVAWAGYANTADDAIALLKEQEAVEPIRDATCVRMFRCGACGAYVGFVDSDLGVPNEQDNYCRNCGRSVKWE